MPPFACTRSADGTATTKAMFIVVLFAVLMIGSQALNIHTVRQLMKGEGWTSEREGQLILGAVLIAVSIMFLHVNGFFNPVMKFLDLGAIPMVLLFSILMVASQTYAVININKANNELGEDATRNVSAIIAYVLIAIASCGILLTSAKLVCGSTVMMRSNPVCATLFSFV